MNLITILISSLSPKILLWSSPRYFDDQPNGNLISSAFPSRVLREWISSDYDELCFEDLIVLLAQGNIPFDPTRSWCDIDQFVEVEKHLAKLNTDFLNHQYSRQDLTNIVLGKNTPRLKCISCRLISSQDHKIPYPPGATRYQFLNGHGQALA